MGERTQPRCRAPKPTHEKALAKAKRLGIPLNHILVRALEAFVEGEDNERAHHELPMVPAGDAPPHVGVSHCELQPNPEPPQGQVDHHGAQAVGTLATLPERSTFDPWAELDPIVKERAIPEELYTHLPPEPLLKDLVAFEDKAIEAIYQKELHAAEARASRKEGDPYGAVVVKINEGRYAEEVRLLREKRQKQDAERKEFRTSRLLRLAALRLAGVRLVEPTPPRPRHEKSSWSPNHPTKKERQAADVAARSLHRDLKPDTS